MIILSIILCILFFTLGGLHIHWLFGGRFGLEASLPSKENGEVVLKPKKIDIVLVAVGLLMMGIFYLVKSGIINYSLPSWLIQLIGWTIPAIFLLRAVGEFHYVGFFKKVRNTKFGKLDTAFFSPLCLFIGILGLLIMLLHRH